MSELPGSPAPRVLVVDDYPAARASLRKLLLRWGWEVREAGDGPEALRAAGEFRPDAVLLDIVMPGMDGVEVAQRLRGMPELGHPLLVAVSGHGAPDVVARALAAGCDRYLVKPVEPDELAALLRGRRPGA
jgi:CheY-like chemotaxis protein